MKFKDSREEEKRGRVEEEEDGGDGIDGTGRLWILVEVKVGGGTGLMEGGKSSDRKREPNLLLLFVHSTNTSTTTHSGQQTASAGLRCPPKLSIPPPPTHSRRGLDESEKRIPAPRQHEQQKQKEGESMPRTHTWLDLQSTFPRIYFPIHDCDRFWKLRSVERKDNP